MSERYGRDAWDLCGELYVKYGGQNFQAIQNDMRKAGYTGWTLKNLNDRGKDGKPTYRMGWINRFGYERLLEKSLEMRIDKVNDDEQGLYLGIKTIRKRLEKNATRDNATNDDLRFYERFAGLEINARRNLDLSRDNLETFVAGYEKQLQWLAVIDPSGKAVKELLKHGEKLIEMAQAHYGKPEEIGDGASPAADEGGEQQGGGLGLVK